MRNILLSAIMMMMFITGIHADEVRLTASARSVVSVGDRFQLTYTVNTKGGQFSGPEISDFRVLSGPNISTSQNYRVINGKMSASTTVSYIYYLQAFKDGSFEIPPASIEVKGEKFISKAVKIEVVKGNPSSSSTQGNTPAQAGGLNTEDDIFLKGYVSNKNPYLGEEIIVTYKIYTTTVSLAINDKQSLTSYPSFWSTAIQNIDEQIEVTEEIIDGKKYFTGVIYKAALFPQKAGLIRIDSKEMGITAQVKTQGNRKPRDPFFDSFFDDPFFNNQYQNIKIALESNPIELNIKPLPIDKKPAGFSGAVGRFSIRASIDNANLLTNDAVTIKLIISGSGNLELINTPEINWPPDFETYEPKITKNIKTTASGVSGSRTFEFLAIPRSAGDFSVGPIELSYFDPATGKYKTVSSKTFEIHVEKGEQSSNAVTYSGVAQEDIMYLGQDIRYIKTGTFVLSDKGQYLFDTPLYYMLLTAPVVMLALLSLLIINSRKKKSNVALVRNRKATKVARKNLKIANQFLKSQQREEFYTEVSRALWGYLSDKFNIPLSDLSMDTIRERLSEKNVSEESIDTFIEVLNKCEFARFAPGESTNLMNEIYQEAIMFISRIESELKS